MSADTIVTMHAVFRNGDTWMMMKIGITDADATYSIYGRDIAAKSLFSETDRLARVITVLLNATKKTDTIALFVKRRVVSAGREDVRIYTVRNVPGLPRTLIFNDVNALNFCGVIITAHYHERPQYIEESPRMHSVVNAGYIDRDQLEWAKIWIDEFVLSGSEGYLCSDEEFFTENAPHEFLEDGSYYDGICLKVPVICHKELCFAREGSDFLEVKEDEVIYESRSVHFFDEDECVASLNFANDGDANVVRFMIQRIFAGRNVKMPDEERLLMICGMIHQLFGDSAVQGLIAEKKLNLLFATFPKHERNAWLEFVDTLIREVARFRMDE